MESKFKKLLFNDPLSLLNEIPAPCHVLLDEKGNWDIRDFNRVWMNKACKALFGNDILGPIVDLLASSKINSLQAHINRVKQLIESGESGFVGPFTNPHTRFDSSVIVLEYHILYLDKTEDGCPAFLVVLSDKTAEHFLHRSQPPIDIDAYCSPWDNLSPRERQVSKLICEGLITKTIADKLTVSERTIDNHRANIRKKLNLSRNTSIAEYFGFKLVQ